MPSEWDRLPTIRVIDAGYLLAGLEPQRKWQFAPPIVKNFYNVIRRETGAVPLATMPDERMELSQEEFQELKGKYSVTPEAKPVPVDQPTNTSHDPVARPLRDEAPNMSRNGLIKAHQHDWPTIDRDLKDASTNGLSATAKAGNRYWNETAALAWARAHGKLQSPAAPTTDLAQATRNMASLPVRKHKLDD